MVISTLAKVVTVTVVTMTVVTMTVVSIVVMARGLVMVTVVTME